MADNTVVIRAEFFSDVPEKAAESAAAVKALGEEIKTSTGNAGTSAEQLGKHLDTVNERTEQIATGSSPKMKKAFDDLHESGSRLRESFAGIGESIKYHLQYPMQQLSYVAEGATAGMVAFGLTTASSLQQANLQLASFTGNASMASTAVTQLRQMQSAVPLGGLTSAYEALSQGGMGQSQLLPMIRALSGISAVSLNPANSMQSMSQAVAAMTSTGLMTTQDVNAFSGSGVDVWGMLAKETGQTPAELRMRFLRAGTPMAVPGSFMGDLTGSSQATGGTSAYEKTWAGQFEMLKKTVGDTLGVFETPLGNALAGASSKIDAWATGTEARFKQMGGSIGQEWSSGNMGGLGHTLANIVGDPKLAGDLTTMGQVLHGFSQIVTQSVIPMAHELLTVASPAFHAFGDVIDFLGKHKTITEGLIAAFGGFVVLSKVARWGEDAAKAIKTFQMVLEDKGLISAMAQFDRGLLGMSNAEQAVAGGTASEAATASVMSRGGPGGLGGASKMLNAGTGLMGLSMFAPNMIHDFASGKKASNMSVLMDTAGTMASAGMMFGPEGALLMGGLGLAGAGAYDLMRGPAGHAIAGAASDVGNFVTGLFGGGHHSSPHVTAAQLQGVRQMGAAMGALQHHTSIGSVKQINITVPGSGNPNKVANAIPKAINSQVNALQQSSTRRGAP